MAFAVPLVAGAIGQAVASSFAANFALSAIATSAIVTIGGGIGAAIGAALVAPSLPGVEGPRALDGLKQESVYGKFIPIPYGRTRIGGNVIWTSKIREVKSTQQSGGKGGGGGQTVTTYTYYCSWALALCEGKVRDIHKIWFDADLIYEAETESTNIPNFLEKVTFYYGDEDQEVDPIMQATEGEGNVPSYKGLSYIVFEDIELTDFGNRIPNITVELSRFPDVGVTSEIYPIEMDQDSYTSFAAYTIGDIFVKNFFQNYVAPNEDRIVISSNFTNTTLRTLLLNYNAPNEDRIVISSNFTNTTLRTLLLNYNAPNEDRIVISSNFVGISLI